MTFRLNTRGEFPIRDGTRERQLLEEVSRALVEHGAQDVVIRSGVVHFRVPWTVTHGPLWSIDGGTVQVVETPGDRHFTYELSRRRAVLSTALVSYGWLGGLSVAAFHQSPLFALGVGTFAF